MQKLMYIHNSANMPFSVDLEESPIFACENYIIARAISNQGSEGVVKIYSQHDEAARERFNKYENEMRKLCSSVEIAKLFSQDFSISFDRIGRGNDSFAFALFSVSLDENALPLREARGGEGQQREILEQLIKDMAILNKYSNKRIVGIDPRFIFIDSASVRYLDLVVDGSEYSGQKILKFTSEADFISQFLIKLYYYLDTRIIENDFDKILRVEKYQKIYAKVEERAKGRQENGGKLKYTERDFLDAVDSYLAEQSSITPRDKDIQRIPPTFNDINAYYKHYKFLSDAESYAIFGSYELLIKSSEYVADEGKLVAVDRRREDTGYLLAERLDYEWRDGIIHPKNCQKIQYGFESDTLYEFQKRAAKKLISRDFGGRGILADQVGMGKTIEAGIIISELACRENKSERWQTLLIVVPDGEKKNDRSGDITKEGILARQWAEELSQKFGLPLHYLDVGNDAENDFVLDRVAPLFDEKGRRNKSKSGKLCYPACIMERHQFVRQCSKYEAHKKKYGEAGIVKIDLVIVDEAHRLMLEGTRKLMEEQIRKIKEIEAGKLTANNKADDSDELDKKILSENKGLNLLNQIAHKYCILITATPHRGDLIVFYPYIKLLRKKNDIFANFEDFYTKFCDRCISVQDYYKKKRSYKDAMRKIHSNMSAIVVRNTRNNTRKDVDWKDKFSNTYYFYEEGNELSTIARDEMFTRYDGNSYIYRDGGSDRQIITLIPYEEKSRKRNQSASTDFNAEEEINSSINKAKIIEAARIIHDYCDEKIIVFFGTHCSDSFIRRAGEEMENELKKQGIKISFTTSSNEFLSYKYREEAEESVGSTAGKAASKKAKEQKLSRMKGIVFLANKKSSEGRNLQKSHVLINFHILNCPMKMEQRIGRIDRIGQQENMLIFSFASLNSYDGQLLEFYDLNLGLFSRWNGDITYVAGNMFDDGGDTGKTVKDFEKSFNNFYDQYSPMQDENSFRIWRQEWGKRKNKVDEWIRVESQDFLVSDESKSTTKFEVINDELIVSGENKTIDKVRHHAFLTEFAF